MSNLATRFVELALIAIILPLFASRAAAATYEVGEGKPFASIGAVPWESLSAGDTVLIYWRATPYREKWVIGRTGTQAAPLTVRGVAGPGGALPVIDGENATTRLALDYWNEQRSVIKVGGSSIPADIQPQYVVIENLDIRGARPPNTFTSDSGGVQTYVANGAAIHVERGAHITIRNCTLRDSGNGLFVTSSDGEAASDILVEGNYILGNGNSGSIFEHNVYVAGIGMVFQYNRFGPLAGGAGGNNLKDRSAGLVVRYNWIEGGNRQLDLVDGEDSVLIRSHPDYGVTHVYGNVLIEPAGVGNKQIVHYGGDGGATGDYRNGTLYFYHNTIVSTRTDTTTLFRLSTNDHHCDARNNIFFVTAAGNSLSMLDSDGVLDLSHNWLKPGWVDSFGGLGGQINDDGTSIETSSPGFVDFANQNYELATESVCIDAATPLPSAVLPEHNVVHQYVKHQSSQPRLVTGDVNELGAFETAAPTAIPAVSTWSLTILALLVLAAGTIVLHPAHWSQPRSVGGGSQGGTHLDGDPAFRGLRRSAWLSSAIKRRVPGLVAVGSHEVSASAALSSVASPPIVRAQATASERTSSTRDGSTGLATKSEKPMALSRSVSA